MKTLLIVEDEKMIRQGIAIMAKRSSIPIDEILECRNGIEALEILKERPIDVMFTDIRMPKMDGIELVKRTKYLEHCPLIVVVSGYDDFNYAVEMLKNGVKDYLLKPIKREKVEEVLGRLDQEITREQIQEEEEIRNLKNQLRYLILGEQAQEKDWIFAEKQLREMRRPMTEEQYMIAVSNRPLPAALQLPALQLPESVWFALDGMAADLSGKTRKSGSMESGNVSLLYTGIFKSP